MKQPRYAGLFLALIGLATWTHAARAEGGEQAEADAVEGSADAPKKRRRRRRKPSGGGAAPVGD